MRKGDRYVLIWDKEYASRGSTGVEDLKHELKWGGEWVWNRVRKSDGETEGEKVRLLKLEN